MNKFQAFALVMFLMSCRSTEAIHAPSSVPERSQGSNGAPLVGSEQRANTANEETPARGVFFVGPEGSTGEYQDPGNGPLIYVLLAAGVVAIAVVIVGIAHLGRLLGL